MTAPAEPTWRPLVEPDLPALIGMASRALVADGGLPLAGRESFLRGRYVDNVSSSTGVFDSGDLIAAAALRAAGGDRFAAVGLVDPARRRLGLGGRLVDWALREAAGMPVRFETESLTDDADALFRSRGLGQTFAEDIMRFDLRSRPPEVALPNDVALIEWSPELANRFFAVYEAAFRDRPGFPGWPAETWIEWISGDDDFAPEWTLLVRLCGADVGFVAAARGAWIVQVGVVPAVRGRGVGAGLTAEVLRRMRAAGETEALLDVNVDNPGATRVYERLGFARIGRRAKYERTNPL